MKKKNKTKILNVYLNDTLVGKLTKEASGKVSFKYDEEWIDIGFHISNSLPIRENIYTGELVTRYFDNLLPDTDEIKQIIATKFGAESIRPFDMLEVIGKDCVGALSFWAEELEKEGEIKLDCSFLEEKEIAKKIRNLGRRMPLGMDSSDFRISIAGAQEKSALLQIQGKWYEPHGQTPTSHIIKAPIGALRKEINFDDSIDNEWASLLIMKKMGLPVCESKIYQFEDQRVLVVKRFDRKWKKYQGKDILLRIPQEDVCQALGISPYQKYQTEGGPGIEDIAKFLMASKRSEDRFDFFKAMMIFDLLFATDGHAKNFSVFLEKDGFRMTPFYDVMSGYFLFKRERRRLSDLKLAMKVGNSGHYNFRKISKRHYDETAKKCGINKTKFEKISSEISELYQKLSISNEELDPYLNRDTLEIILEGMKKRAKIVL